MLGQAALTSHATTDWETPWEIYKALDKEFHFDLDPCCNLKNQKSPVGYGPHEHGAAFDGTVKKLPDGKLHFSANGLSTDWDIGDNGSTSVYINPPYSAGTAEGEIKKKGKDTSSLAWVMLGKDWSLKGLTVVMLIASRTETQQFQIAAKFASEIRFVYPRIAFLKNGIVPKKSPPFANLIVVFRPERPNDGPKYSMWRRP